MHFSELPQFLFPHQLDSGPVYILILSNLIIYLPYLLTAPLRPTGTICAIVWLLQGDSAENKLADSPPLPGDLTRG